MVTLLEGSLTERLRIEGRLGMYPLKGNETQWIHRVKCHGEMFRDVKRVSLKVTFGCESFD